MDNIVCENDQDIDTIPSFNQSSFSRRSGISIRIKYRNFQLIPEDLFQNLKLKCLDLSNNKLIKITNESFKGSQLTDTLKLDSNQIVSIDNTFKSINDYNDSNCLKYRQLQYIDLSNNIIQSLTQKSFNCLQNLKFLLLHNNHILIIENNTFENLIRLERLSLANNKITSIERSSFKGLSILSTLILSKNQIRIIQNDTFLEFGRRFYSLFLDNNLIDKIQVRGFFGLNKLTSLYLDNNCLTNITNSLLAPLKFLQRIVLGGNKMIQYLDKNTFYGLEKIDEVTIKNTPISEFRHFTYNLFNLVSLNLDKNRITTIESKNSNEKDFKYFRTICLNFNFIENITKTSFKNFKIIENIELNNNLIKWIENGSFIYLGSLKYLFLANNLIKRIEFKLLVSNYYYFDTIDLSSNYIEIIDEFSLIGFETLILNLLDNPINFVDSKAFDQTDIKIAYIPMRYFLMANESEVIGALKPRLIRAFLGYTFYRSFNVKTYYKDIYSYTNNECQKIIFYLKKNILINIIDGNDVEIFLNTCFN